MRFLADCLPGCRNLQRQRMFPAIIFLVGYTVLLRILQKTFPNRSLTATARYRIRSSFVTTSISTAEDRKQRRILSTPLSVRLILVPAPLPQSFSCGILWARAIWRVVG